MSTLAAALALSLLAAPLRASEGKPAEPIGRIVGSGKPVYLNDRLMTGATGRLQIRLKDDTLFTIGPNSSLVVDEFVYDPASGLGRVTASVLQGVFQFITGKVGKKQPENMKVRLPACTIGINGTAVMGRVEVGRDTVVLTTGAITVSNDAGITHLPQAGYAVTVDAGQAPGTPFIAPLPLLASLAKSLAPDKREKPSAPPPSEKTPRPVDFDDIVDALIKHDDLKRAESLKKDWLERIESVHARYPDQVPPAPTAQWLIKQGTPLKAFVRSADAAQAQAAKEAVAARYGLTPAALARLEGLFK